MMKVQQLSRSLKQLRCAHQSHATIEMHRNSVFNVTYWAAATGRGCVAILTAQRQPQDHGPCMLQSHNRHQPISLPFSHSRNYNRITSLFSPGSSYTHACVVSKLNVHAFLPHYTLFNTYHAHYGIHTTINSVTSTGLLYFPLQKDSNSARVWLVSVWLQLWPLFKYSVRQKGTTFSA